MRLISDSPKGQTKKKKNPKNWKRQEHFFIENINTTVAQWFCIKPIVCLKIYSLPQKNKIKIKISYAQKVYIELQGIYDW